MANSSLLDPICPQKVKGLPSHLSVAAKKQSAQGKLSLGERQ